MSFPFLSLSQQLIFFRDCLILVLIVTLNSGQEMPLIGLGTWQAPAGEVGKAVKLALESGTLPQRSASVNYIIESLDEVRFVSQFLAKLTK